MAYPNYLEKDKAVLVSQAELERLREEGTDLSTYAINKWTFKVSDILNVPQDHEVTPDLVVATWRLAGIESRPVDITQNGINFEVMVNASQVIALNAFHWALLNQIRVHNELRLSDLIGDVAEDEPVGKTMRWNSRAFRVWGMTTAQLVTGMNVLFNEVEVKQ